jgi:hypothetical protein
VNATRGGLPLWRRATRRLWFFRGSGPNAAKQRRSPSFSASIPKSRLFCSKLFQAILWRFCGIPWVYKGSKPNLMVSKFFQTICPASAILETRYAPFSASPPAVGVSRAFNGSRTFVSHGGGAIRIERILNLARILILGNEMSLSFSFLSRSIAERIPPSARERPVI